MPNFLMSMLELAWNFLICLLKSKSQFYSCTIIPKNLQWNTTGIFNDQHAIKVIGI